MNYTKRTGRLMSFIITISIILTMIPVHVFAADSGWKLKTDTEIFLVKTDTADINDTELVSQIKLFASELAEKVTGTALPVSYGSESDAGAHDIILVLDSTLSIPVQGYVVYASETNVKISASDADGLFYGCRYLIKQLMLNDSVSDAEESPDVLERALSLDNGRKYFSVEWIKEMIRELSWSDMNALVLHFSEEMGIGIESKLYSWLAGRDGTLGTQAEVTTDNSVLKQDEIKEIVEYAKLYHVEIIPSLDSPGHMNYLVKKFNEQCVDGNFGFTYNGKEYIVPADTNIGNYYHYNGTTSIVQGSRNTAYSRGIDISNEIAVAFVHSLIEEYANLFHELGCTKFDIGGDELLGWGSAIVSISTASRWKQLDHWKTYAQDRAKAEGLANYKDAVAYDGFMYYMNDLYDLVSGLGYTSVRMWNDDALRSYDTGWKKVVNLNTNIDIWYWQAPSNDKDSKNPVSTYIDAGYQVYNMLNTYCYYALTGTSKDAINPSYKTANQENIYNNWTPYNFGTKTLEIGNKNVLGSAIGVWCDNPDNRTAEQVMSDVLPMIRAHGAKAWDASENESISYSNFTANLAKIGDAPEGAAVAPEIYVVAYLTALQNAVEAYSFSNPDLYTTESFSEYTNAVEAGKVLLEADKPIQSDVDAATENINSAKNALELKPTVDTSKLEKLIAEYEGVDSTLYTTESYRNYREAAESGKALLAGGNYEQKDIDTAAVSIQSAYDGLQNVPTEEIDWFVQGAFKTSKVYVGKVATLSISTKKNIGVTGIAVYNDLGELKEYVLKNVNTRNAARDIHTLIFAAEAKERGDRTYRVYAEFEDGTRSADYREFTITVK